VVASGVSAKDYASPFDSAWLDLSKGLGCPVGAVLCGSRECVDRAWRFKHQFGGAMRQAGIIAGAGVYALENHVDRLAEDHENAQVLARGLAEIAGLSLNPNEVETNIVFFDVSGTGMTADQVHERLLEHRIRIGVRDRTVMRAVTHLDVDRAGIERALDAMRKVCAGKA
jgi:threonine aldolase